MFSPTKMPPRSSFPSYRSSPVRYGRPGRFSWSCLPRAHRLRLAGPDAPAGPQPRAAPQAQVQYAQYAAGQDPNGELPIGADTENYADTNPSALTDFRAALDPYGSWQEDPTYGTVWVPSENVVGSDFSPYVTGGQWAYGDDYVWMSDYAWGWAPFHYGRWAYLNDRGWGWIPGRRYAGAWVSWRVGEGGYVGWGAMPPTWGWRNGAAVGMGPSRPRPTASPTRASSSLPSVGEHVLSGPQVAGIAAHTQPTSPQTPASTRRLAPASSGRLPPRACT